MDSTYENHTFLHFVSQNVAWIATDMNSCPLAEIDDGKNDITIISQETNGGRVALARYLLNSETGDFFNNDGQIAANLAMHYLKAKEWTLDPHVKSEPPAGFEQSDAYAYDNNAFYSIDGERYKSQKLSAKVLSKYLPIYV